MRTRRTASIATGAVMALMLTGCGGVEPSAWASEVCGSLKGVDSSMKKAAKNMKIDPSDPESTRTSMVKLLGVAETQSAKLASDVEDAGTPDVENGEKDSERLVGQLEKASTAFGKAKGDLEKADASSQQKLGVAIAKLQEDLAKQGARVSDPTAQLKSKELRTAIEKDKDCSAVRS